MKTIKTGMLNPNKYFSEPVFIYETFPLLYPELELTDKKLSILKKWQIKSVTTDGFETENVPGKSNIKENKEVEENAQDNEITKFYKQTLEIMNNIFLQYKNKKFLNVKAVLLIAKQLKTKVLENPDAFLQIKIIKFEDYLIRQSVKTAILAILIGKKYKLPDHKLLDLTICALLHKIGMTRIPKEIYLSNKKLSESEKKLIMQYPIISGNILKEFGFSSEIIQGVLEHQELYNGKGYPQHLQKDIISFFGRVVCICSAYCAATSFRPFKDGKKRGHAAVLDILKNSSTMFDPNICKILILILSIYPLGSFVELENKKRGIVIKTTPNNPKYPFVKLLVDENLKPLTLNEIVNTKDEGKNITKTLSEEEIKQIKNIYKQNPSLLNFDIQDK